MFFERNQMSYFANLKKNDMKSVNRKILTFNWGDMKNDIYKSY